MSGTLKIHVDQDKCQGHARCKSLAPELFELDEYGNAHEIGDGTVPKGLEDKAWLAQTNCPEIAIEITEEEVHERDAAERCRGHAGRRDRKAQRAAGDRLGSRFRPHPP